MVTELLAPGAPGIDPRWTTSNKAGVGTAPTGDCNVWFTVGHGILNEVYFPRIDVANIRDMELIVTDGESFFSEEKRHAFHTCHTVIDGVPAFELVNTCKQGRYIIKKVVIADPRRDVILQKIEFIPLVGTYADYHIYALLAPHIGNSGSNNTGWTDDYKGFPMLFASNNGVTLAMASSSPFTQMTCGYVGSSDAWQDLFFNKKLTHCYNRASHGNIALCGEIDLKACEGKFVLAISFGHIHEKAGIQARASLFRDFEWAFHEYVQDWETVQKDFADLSPIDTVGGSIYRTSTALLKSHGGKKFAGSVIASLSIPWGAYKGDNDIGGYHLIWPRDQVQTAEAFLASGNWESARQVLLFLMCTQEQDGRWSQCMWEDGKPYWQGLQMDEIALPLLLAERLHRHNMHKGIDPTSMVERAAAFLVLNGPATEQDRWEENSGYTPFTLAVEIAGLLSAAEYLESVNKGDSAEFLRSVADWWNNNIERWLYVTDTHLSQQFDVAGYYVRVAPAEPLYDTPPSPETMITINNRHLGENRFNYRDIISVDALALVRYGLRAANDPRILNTVKVIDGVLKKMTVNGPIWHRYNEDGYGEHDNGDPFNGTGRGRGWPLLSGERAHYELELGNIEEAKKLLRTLVVFAGEGGMIPEQVWDAEDISEKGLHNGLATGSAKPLVWAHAEYISLLKAITDKQVATKHPKIYKRYVEKGTKPSYAIWRENFRCKTIQQGLGLRILLKEPSMVRWTQDGWKTSGDITTKDTGLGVFYADLPVKSAPKGTLITFTILYQHEQRWSGENYEIVIV